MAFNFGTLVGGFAEGVEETIDAKEEEKRLIRAEDRQLANQLKLMRAKRAGTGGASRAKKAEALQNKLGLMQLLGYTPETIEQISGMGASAMEFAITNGGVALQKGLDPNTLFNSTNGNQDDMVDITSAAGTTPTTEMPPPLIVDTPPADIDNMVASGAIPDSTAAVRPTVTIDVADDVAGGAAGDLTRVSIGGINRDVFMSLQEVPEVEATYSGALARLSQLIARDPTGTKADQYRSERDTLLEDYRKYKAAEKQDGGPDTPSYTLPAISSAIRETRATALSVYGFELGLNDQIKNMDEGTEHFASIANLNAVQQLATRNSGIKDANMAAAIRGLYDTSRIDLQEYAADQYNKKLSKEVTTNEFVNLASTGAYAKGSVFNDGTNLYVYTGYVDPYSNMPFLLFPMVN